MIGRRRFLSLLGFAPVAASVPAGASLPPPEKFIPGLPSRPIVLRDGETLTLDFNAGINFAVTLSGSGRFANPVNGRTGQSGAIVVRQDSIGGRKLRFGLAWHFNVKPALSIEPERADIIWYHVFDRRTIFCALTKAVAA